MLSDRVGVQLHLRKEGTPYYDLPRVIAALKDLGAGHVRDSFNVGWPTQNAQIRQVADACGAKFTLTARMSDTVAGFVAGAQALGDAVTAVEGVNEWDNTGHPDWANELRAHQAALYAAVKAAMPNMPVLAPALADASKASILGPVPCDYGNAHAYPNGAPSSWLAAPHTAASSVSGGKPLVVTETGYTTALHDPDVVYHHPVTEVVAGGYMANLVTTHLDAGAQRVFVYELFDQGAGDTDVELGFGLLRNDGTPKPAYTALQTLLGRSPVTTTFDDALTIARTEYEAAVKAAHDADDQLAASEAQRVNERDVAAALVKDLRGQVAALTAKLAAVDPWQVLHTYDLTRDEGWQINTGARPSVDFSTGQKGMVNFGPDGLRLTAQPAGTKIASCDIIAKFVPLPTFRAIEMDLEFSGPLGPGLFPAPYWTKTIEGGGGEFDGVEQLGALAGTDMQWKMTAIALPATSPLIQIQKPLVPFFKAHDIDPTAKNTWRWEHTDGKVELLINGLSAATITRTEFDAAGPLKNGTPLWPAKPGRWDSQFQDAAKHNYVRHTWQVGPRGDGKPGGMGGTVPKDWAGSSFLISRMVAYVPKGVR